MRPRGRILLLERQKIVVVVVAVLVWRRRKPMMADRHHRWSTDRVELLEEASGAGPRMLQILEVL